MFKKTNEWLRLSLALTLIIALVVGFFAGVVGELWLNNFLAPDIQFKNYQDLTKRLDELTTAKNQTSSGLLTEQDLALKKGAEKFQSALVFFYNYKKADAHLENVYLPANSLGTGFILTSDGWLVTSKQVLADSRQQYGVVVAGVSYATKLIVPDTLTEAVFVKIEANNLAVAELSSRHSLSIGQSLLVATATNGFKQATINQLGYRTIKSSADLINSSENFDHRILLNNSFSVIDLGSPVINSQGKVIGLLTESRGLVLAVDYFGSIIRSVTQNQKIKHNFLGVNYLDLDRAPNFSAPVKHGAYLLGDYNRRAVLLNSPAAKAGLQAGDIVLKVEDDEVNLANSLSELIADYPNNTKINLTILRAGKEQNISVTLGSI